MGVLENSVDIARPVPEVFDYCSDLCNELEWTPGSMTAVERLTEGPIGVGTRYRATWKQGGTHEVAYTQFERPTSWVAAADSPSLSLIFRARVDPTDSGSRLTVQMDLRPHGLTKLASPILHRVMQRQELLNLAAVKRTLESR